MPFAASLDDDSFFGAYNRVAKFTGHFMQRMENRESHDWCLDEDDEDCAAGACRVCCAQSYDNAADWPCGQARRESVSRR
jgi:hypothetical protein